MKCPKCNEEVKGKEKFCVKCGFNLEETRKEEKATKKENGHYIIYHINHSSSDCNNLKCIRKKIT